MYRFLSCLTIIIIAMIFTGCSALSSRIIPDKFAIHSGYSWSAITGDDIESIPTAVRYELNINRLVYLNPRYGKLNFGIEGIGNSLLRPKIGMVVGITPVLRYAYSLRSDFRLYIEAGAGPIYLSIDTYEQEKAGFSFYDQIGAGMEFNVRPDMSIILGYRFSHISHGRLLRTRNRGIEGDTVIFGLSFSLP